MSHTITEDDVRSKAYELWEHAGCPDGGADIYWVQAQMALGDGKTMSSAPSDSEMSSPASSQGAQ